MGVKSKGVNFLYNTGKKAAGGTATGLGKASKGIDKAGRAGRSGASKARKGKDVAKNPAARKQVRTQAKAKADNWSPSVSRTTSKRPGQLSGITKKSTLRLGKKGERSSVSAKTSRAAGGQQRVVKTTTVSRRAAGGAGVGAAGVAGAGGYTTYKRRTKSGKTITVRRRTTRR